MNILIKNNSFIAKRFLILSFSILTIFAQEVNRVYKTAKAVIETTHGSEFAAEPKIYLCMTKER